MSTDADSDAASQTPAAGSYPTTPHAPRAAAELDASVYQRRASFALELGRRVLTEPQPVADGTASAVAVQLFRQSLYWSLQARTGSRAAPTAAQTFAEHSDELRARLGAEATDGLEVLESFEFETLAAYPAERLRALAANFERIAFDCSAEQRSAGGAAQRESTSRVWVVFVALGLGLVALTALVFGLFSKPNLAEGKPWSTSSVFAACDTKAKRCGGVATAVFFHTNEEENPWFEYDFGAPLQFSSLTILNRSDAVQDRAVPLVVEISNDKKTYRALASRKRVFDVWEPSFPAVRARYLRLRVARKSFLHLDGVEVHP